MDTTLVEQFSAEKSKEKVQVFYEKVIEIITRSLSDVATKLPAISPDYIRVFAIGDYTNNTFIEEEGELEIAITNSDPQMILANKNYKKNLEEAKNAKARKAVSINGTSHEFLEVFFAKVAMYFGPETKLIWINNGIKVLCKKELNLNLLIRFGTFDRLDKEGKIMFWNAVSKKEEAFRLFQYTESIEKKDKASKGNYKKIVRILKNLRKTMILNKWINANDYNRYFVELLAYNVPDKLLKGTDIVSVYSKAMLYMSNCDLNTYKDTLGQPLIYNKVANADFAKIKKFLACANSILE